MNETEILNSARIKLATLLTKKSAGFDSSSIGNELKKVVREHWPLIGAGAVGLGLAGLAANEGASKKGGSKSRYDVVWY